MKMVAANVGRACFSFQSTNQTRRYCSRKFKADRGENTSSSKKCMERSIHHYCLIGKNAVETSVAQAAQKVNQFFFFFLFYLSRLQLLNQTALLLLTQPGTITLVKLVVGSTRFVFVCYHRYTSNWRGRHGWPWAQLVIIQKLSLPFHSCSHMCTVM